MKQIFILTLVGLITIENVFSQRSHQHADSLEQYSYPILGIYPSFTAGTGFFLTYNDSLYFITAKHVVTGCDDKRNKRPNYPDKLIIGDYKDMEHSFFIDTKVIRQALPCDGIDMYIHPISGRFKPYYKTVDQFILPKISEFATLEIFGYPITSYDTGYVGVPRKSKHLTMPTETFDFTYALDSAGNINKLYQRVSHPKSVEVIGGYSGSPIFLQDRQTGNWRIIGIVSATESTYGGSRGGLLYVDIQHVLNLLEISAKKPK